MAARNNSVASQSANIQQRASQIAGQVQAEQGRVERMLKPKKIAARYPIKGKVLLFATCGFGSLGDALFGYNSGMYHAPVRPMCAHPYRYHVRSSRQSCLCQTILQRFRWCRRKYCCSQPFHHRYISRLSTSFGCRWIAHRRTPR